jgi:hypothetical protein
VDVTGGNVVLPNRPILDVAFDPTTTTAPKGYAAVGGFNANTPTRQGHVFQVVCTANCAAFVWTNKTGNLPDIPVDSIIANPKFPKQVFAGTDFGLYYTDDITAVSPNWLRFENGLPHAMIWDMQIDRGSTTLSVWTRSRGAYAWPLPSGPVPVPPLQSVVSRKIHGGTLQADITLPLTGQRGVECRSPGQTGTSGVDYKVVFTFVNDIVPGGCGSTSTPGGSVAPGPTTKQCTVNLTYAPNPPPNAQYITVTLTNVTDVAGNTGPASAVMGLLIGDVNGDVPNAPGLVDSGDVFLVRQNTGQATTLSNFRKDINASGVIDSGDVFLTRQKTGSQLPTPP